MNLGVTKELLFIQVGALSDSVCINASNTVLWLSLN